MTMHDNDPQNVSQAETPELELLQMRILELEAENSRLKDAAVSALNDTLIAVMDHLPVLFNALDSDRRMMFWNHEAERVTGYTKAEMENNLDWLQLLYPDEAYRANLIRIRQEHGSVFKNVEADVTCKDGTIRTISWSSLVSKFAVQGWAVWSVGIDVTERKQYEAAIEESRRRFEALFNHSHDAVFVVSLEFQNITANQRAADLLGYTVDEIASSHSVAAPEEQNDSRHVLERILAGETIPIYERNFMCKDGSLLPVEVTVAPIHDAAGNVLQVLSVCRDISQRKEMESRLRKSEAWFQAIFNSRLVGMMLLDNEGVIFRVNRTFADALGLSVEELHHQPFIQLVEKERRAYVSYVFSSIAAGNKDSEQFAIRSHHKSGNEIWLDVMMMPQRDSEGQIQSMVLMAKDVTLEKSASQRAIQLEVERRKNQVITEFVSAASHEFRTPLSRIHTNAYLIRKTHEDEPTIQRIQNIESESTHILKLIEGLLTTVNLNSDRVVDFRESNFNAIVATVGERLSSRFEQNELTYHEYLDGDLPKGQFQPELIQEMLVQLLDNAIRFNQPGGEVMVRTSYQDNRIIAEIQDTGVGIPEEVLPRLFDQFFRQDLARSTPGLGLGLTIVKKIVEHHNGEILVESQPGEGTTVKLRLPIHQPIE